MTSEPKLTSMNISLPVTQKDYVRERSVQSGCSTPSEYIRRLIHADQERVAKTRLDQQLLAGLNSGASAEMTPDDWADIRREVAKRVGKKRSSK